MADPRSPQQGAGNRSVQRSQRMGRTSGPPTGGAAGFNPYGSYGQPGSYGPYGYQPASENGSQSAWAQQISQEQYAQALLAAGQWRGYGLGAATAGKQPGSSNGSLPSNPLTTGSSHGNDPLRAYRQSLVGLEMERNFCDPLSSPPISPGFGAHQLSSGPPSHDPQSRPGGSDSTGRYLTVPTTASLRQSPAASIAAGSPSPGRDPTCTPGSRSGYEASNSAMSDAGKGSARSSRNPSPNAPSSYGTPASQLPEADRFERTGFQNTMHGARLRNLPGKNIYDFLPEDLDAFQSVRTFNPAEAFDQQPPVSDDNRARPGFQNAAFPATSNPAESLSRPASTQYHTHTLPAPAAAPYNATPTQNPSNC